MLSRCGYFIWRGSQIANNYLLLNMSINWSAIVILMARWLNYQWYAWLLPMVLISNNKSIFVQWWYYWWLSCLWSWLLLMMLLMPLDDQRCQQPMSLIVICLPTKRNTYEYHSETSMEPKEEKKNGSVTCLWYCIHHRRLTSFNDLWYEINHRQPDRS